MIPYKTANQWALSSLIGFGILASQAEVMALGKLPVDGTMRTIRAEKVEDPYEKDEYYAYSKSASFRRWVYSPWTDLRLKANQGLILDNNENEEKRAVLISEFSIGTEHLDKNKQYQLLLEKDYVCGDKDTQVAQACTLQFVVRCYGKTKDSDWGITYEKTSQKRVETGEGKFTSDEAVFSPAQCERELYVSAETNLLPKVQQYVFKSLSVGLKEAKPQTARR